MEENKEENIQEMNITSLWHKNIYDSLIRCENYEKVCREGSESLMEYLDINIKRKAEVQFKSFEMYLTEISILLSNTTKLLEKEFLTKAKKDIEKIKREVDSDSDKFLVVMVDRVANVETNRVSIFYYMYLNTLTNIRSDLVSKLSKTLFGVEEVKPISLDKEKKGSELVE